MDPSGRTYEDFVPPHRTVREPPTHTLSVDLTAAGYKKEHIRVQLVHSHRRLIVRGERPVAGNRWSRFRLEFKLPDDCDAKGIQARFEKGVVSVTIPGLTPEPVAVISGGQQKPAASPPATNATAASGGVQDDDRAAPAPAGRGEELKQRVSSTKDGGRDDDDGASTEEEEATDSAPSSRQGYAFLQNRRKMATTLLGAVLVLISLGFYIRYSFWP